MWYYQTEIIIDLTGTNLNISHNIFKNLPLVKNGQVEAGWQNPDSPLTVLHDSSVWNEAENLGFAFSLLFTEHLSLQWPQNPPPVIWFEESSTWKFGFQKYKF